MIVKVILFSQVCGTCWLTEAKLKQAAANTHTKNKDVLVSNVTSPSSSFSYMYCIFVFKNILYRIIWSLFF